MARLARVVAVNVPHHVTQRGNARRFILDRDADCSVYLDLLTIDIQQCDVKLLGYCLMSNHVHLILAPTKVDGLAKVLKRTHARYASYWNALHGSNGHAWQGRFYSCPLGETHLWQALRYVELNPVRARLVSDPTAWAFSSAGVHCQQGATDDMVDLDFWRGQWTPDTWRQYLATADTESELAAIRRSTYTGRPLGTDDFIGELEQRTKRRLAVQKGGRPKKAAAQEKQVPFSFLS